MIFQLFKTVEEVNSPINGKIKVVKDFTGVRFIVDGTSQSGWSMKAVWESGLKKVKMYTNSPHDVLVLGLGGGSAVEVINKLWKNTSITGVDIDATIVNLGKKYLRVNRAENLKILITDAYRWVLDQSAQTSIKTNKLNANEKSKRKKKVQKYDLILVDVYRGERIPDAFRREIFLKEVKNLLNDYGLIAYNHLYGPQDKENAKNLLKTLRKIYPKVVSFYPSSNVIFLCFPENKKVKKLSHCGN